MVAGAMEIVRMYEQLQSDSPKVLAFRLTGRMHHADYRDIEPKVKSAVTSEGKVRLLAQMDGFRGWDLHSMWDDMKFGVRHFSDFDRIAMVGDRRWERVVAGMCKPFTRAKVKYFDAKHADAAWGWVNEGIEPSRTVH